MNQENVHIIHLKFTSSGKEKKKLEYKTKKKKKLTNMHPKLLLTARHSFYKAKDSSMNELKVDLRHAESSEKSGK